MDVSSLTIRRGAPADAPAIAALARRIFHESFAADNRPEDMAAYMALAFGPEQQRRELSDDARTYFLAEHAHALVGYALVHAGGEVPDCVIGRPCVEIVRFYVDRPWHGAGIATPLMLACEGEARRRGARAMWLGVWERNSRAIGFYTKRGFRDVGSHHFVLGTDVQTDRVMARELDTGSRSDADFLGT